MNIALNTEHKLLIVYLGLSYQMFSEHSSEYLAGCYPGHVTGTAISRPGGYEVYNLASNIPKS